MGTTEYQRPKDSRRAGAGARDDAVPKSKVILDRASLRKALSVDDSIEGGSVVGAGLITALQSIIFGLSLVVIPVLLTSVFSTTLVDQDFHFGAALVAGIKLWLLSHGSPIGLAGVIVSLVPLGITALVVLLMAVSVRRSLRPEPLGVLTYCVAYVAVIGVISGVLSEGAAGVLRGLLGASLLSITSVLFGLRRRPDVAPLRRTVSEILQWLPSWLRASVVGAIASFAMAIAVATVTTLMWIYLGKDAMGDVLEGWQLDALSGAGLGITQMVLLPNLVVFALSWLAGPGFSIGAGTVVSPQEVVLGPVPNLPLLAAIPQSTAPASFAVGFIILVALAGLVGGMAAARRVDSLAWWGFLALPVSLGGIAWLIMAAVAWFASGEVGGGAALTMGPSVFGASNSVALWVLCGAFVGLLFYRPEPRAAVRRLFSRNDRVYDLESDD